jgi:hypothetical protein
LTESTQILQELSLEGDTKSCVARKAYKTHYIRAAFYSSVEIKFSTLKMLGKISSDFFAFLLVSHTLNQQTLGMNTH